LLLEPEQPIDFYETGLDSSVSWLWTFGDDSISISSEPSHNYLYGGNYTVCLEASNQFNCFDTSCIELIIVADEIIIPNIFTPNNDLVNDQFEIQGINNEFTLQIFNRWGEMVFEELSYQNNWKGERTNGGFLTTGTYFFILTSDSEKIEKKRKY
jgi:gliding motility-associated-like protein